MFDKGQKQSSMLSCDSSYNDIKLHKKGPRSFLKV